MIIDHFLEGTSRPSPKKGYVPNLIHLPKKEFPKKNPDRADRSLDQFGNRFCEQMKFIRYLPSSIFSRIQRTMIRGNTTTISLYDNRYISPRHDPPLPKKGYVPNELIYQKRISQKDLVRADRSLERFGNRFFE